MAELTIPDYASLEDRYQIVNNTIAEFISGLPQHEPLQISGDRRSAIDRCFEPYRIEDIFSLLNREAGSSGPQASWAEKTIETMQGRSPTSLKVTLKQMALGREWKIDEAFQREHSIAANFMAHPDFVNGVSARLVQKPPRTPEWQPARLEDVSDADVDTFFETIQGPPRLVLLKNASPKTSYHQYPHSWTALPKEEDVANYIRHAAKTEDLATSENLLQHFMSKTNGKPGVREVITDILQRQTVQEGDQLQWRSDWEAEQKRKASLQEEQNLKPS